MTLSSLPVCMQCGLEMRPASIGILAIYMAFLPPQPYEIRSGDVRACPNCGIEVVSGWGQEKHYSAGEPFEDEIARAISRDKVLIVYEGQKMRDMMVYPGSDPIAYIRGWLVEQREKREKEGRGA